MVVLKFFVLFEKITMHRINACRLTEPHENRLQRIPTKKPGCYPTSVIRRPETAMSEMFNHRFM
jgi:hypothetical protein